ncbi:MAG: hypothetical protein ABIG94_09510, partial [Pseudomonadota bacterium]
AGTARHGCLDMESFHVRDFLFIREIFSGTGFQPVQMQAKACGYILSIHPLNTECRIPAGQHWGWGGFHHGWVNTLFMTYN